MIRIMIIWRLYWGPLILANYHITKHYSEGLEDFVSK